MSVSTHALPHRVGVSPPHDRPQVPPEQTSPAAHVTPQPPQFARLDCVSTHEDPQRVGVAPPHSSPQVPPEQTSPGEQTTPQPPQ
jgi:hypothetical protein